MMIFRYQHVTLLYVKAPRVWLWRCCRRVFFKTTKIAQEVQRLFLSQVVEQSSTPAMDRANNSTQISLKSSLVWSNTKEEYLATLPEPNDSILHRQPSGKSHARKQPPGHIPRPRNPFILFRCAVLAQETFPPHLNREGKKDHKSISRFVGDLWNALDCAQRKPWEELAEREKTHHAEVHGLGGYAEKSRNKVRQRDPPPPDYSRRSSSCPPPGSIPFVYQPPTSALSAQDDTISQRRPSRVMLYHSSPSMLPEPHMASAVMKQFSPGIFDSAQDMNLESLKDTLPRTPLHYDYPGAPGLGQLWCQPPPVYQPDPRRDLFNPQRILVSVSFQTFDLA